VGIDRRAPLDLATTIERTQSSFVVSDPSLPDCPIIFASDSFLELTGYSREEVVGRNCRFLQGPGTDRATVREIRRAIEQEKECSVRVLNYTKDGREFWNLFSMAPVMGSDGRCRFFVGVQLDLKKLSESSAKAAAHKLQQQARLVTQSLSRAPDKVELWPHPCSVVPVPPHRRGLAAHTGLWEATGGGEKQLEHSMFDWKQMLGSGDVGRVYLAQLQRHRYAIKVIDKRDVERRKKAFRIQQEIDVLIRSDHPFVTALYGIFQDPRRLHLVLEHCPGGEVFSLLERQREHKLPEHLVQFWVAETVLALQYLHLHGVVHRDVKPENLLLTEQGHIRLADFDLSFSCEPHLRVVAPGKAKAAGEGDGRPAPRRAGRRLSAEAGMSGRAWTSEEPVGRTNSFVGTEEYLAPEVVYSNGHGSGVDWWSLGVLTYELLYGTTPFKGSTRDSTFKRIVAGRFRFPPQPPVSAACKAFIRELLQVDAGRRLGARGAEELKRHAFFRGVRWQLLHHAEPPYNPVTETIAPAPGPPRRPSVRS